MDPLSYFDFIFFGIVIISALVGYVTGLAKELATFIASLGALGVAFLTYRMFGDRFSEQLVSAQSAFDFALLVYIAVAIAAYIILATVLTMLIGNLTDTRGVSVVDKILGLLIGVARGFAIGILFVFFVDVFIARDRAPEFVTQSSTYPFLLVGSDVLLKAYLPDNQNTLDNSEETE